MSDSNGQRVKGYEIREQLGKGGFGAVYRAYQPVVGREVAIKMILPIFANQPDFIRRFETEAQLIARLEHPHIVPLFDYWRDTDGAFLVMRFLRAGSLHQAIQNNPVTPQNAVEIITQVSSALALAHRNGIVHRDVKPQNIMLDDEGNAYLTDFGIALSAANQREKDDEEFFTGSPLYASPELIRGKDITPQTDIYALGMVLYEMLVGKHPFHEGSLTQIIYSQFNTTIPDLPEDLNLHPDVTTVIRKATDKNPAERYHDVASLARAFRQAVLGEVDIKTSTAEMSIIKNPFKGLQAFEEADANDFYGREGLVEVLLNRLREEVDTDQTDYTRFLAVVGPSGSGKSSVVQAGLIPAIRNGALDHSENWFIVQIEPDDKPISNICSALLSVARKPPSDLEERLRNDPHSLQWAINATLPDKDSELVFVIDNFEELFTLTESEEERLHYLNLLYNGITAPDSRLRVIVMLRADYYDKPLLYEDFGALMQDRTQLVLPLSRLEIERAVKSPAEQAGLQVDGDFLEAILADLRDEPGALPLLQYALTETFAQREGRRLTIGAYRTTGGVYGALSRRAEEVYNSLQVTASPDQMPMDLQDLARQIFLRLITIGDTGDKRRRTARSELITLSDAQSVNRILDAFGQYRLLTFEGEMGTREPKVEIAHEALIREWERLQQWLEVSREDLRTERWLFNATDEWLKAGKEDSYLATGGRLAQLETWASTTDLSLTADEKLFLDASIRVRQTRLKAEQDRQQRELDLARENAETNRRAAQRLRIFIVGLLIAFMGVVGLAGVARNAQQHALDNAEQAQSLQTAFNALVEKNPNIALALALDATNITNPPSEVLSILVETAYAKATKRIYLDHTSPVMTVALSADGKTMLTAGGRYTPTQNDTQEEPNDNVIRLWDIDSHTVIKTFDKHSDTVWSVAFSPDNQTFVSASSDKLIYLWDITSGNVLKTFTGHTQDVRSVAFSPDGKTILSGSGAYSNGKHSASDDFSVRLWDVATGKQLCQMTTLGTSGTQGIESEVRHVTFSPDGTQALSSSGAEYSATGENDIILWDIKTCKEIRRLRGHSNIVQDVAFSPDGTKALSASADGTVRLWDLSTGEEIRRFIGHTDWVNQVEFDTSGQFAISGGWDNVIIKWDVKTGRPLYEYIGHSNAIQALAFNPDGRTFFSGSQDDQVRQWDYESPLFVQRYGTSDQNIATSTLLSPDGKWLLSATADGSIHIYDTASAQEMTVFKGHTSKVLSMAFTQDSQQVLSTDNNQQMILWTVSTGIEVRRYRVLTGNVWRAVFSPDDSKILTGGDDSIVRVWDTATGKILHPIEGDFSESYTVAYAPDGQSFFAGTFDGEIIQWDANTFAELRRLKGHTGAPYVSTFSADGRYLATGGYDNLIFIWNVQTGALVQKLVGHNKTIVGVAFTDQDQTLVSASQDSTVRLWNVTSGEEKGRFDYGLTLVGMSLSTDETLIALASIDSPVTTNHLPITDLTDLKGWIANNRDVQELTCEQRLQYRLPSAPSCP